MVRTKFSPKRKKTASKGSNGNGNGKGNKKGNGGAGGRPTKFNAEKQRLVIVGAKKGFTNDELAELLGVTEPTLWNWQQIYPEFFSAIKENKKLWDDQIVKSARNRAKGFYVPEEKIFCNALGEVTRVQTQKYYPPDPTAFIFWLCNRQSQDWKRNLESKEDAKGAADLKQLQDVCSTYAQAQDEFTDAQ